MMTGDGDIYPDLAERWDITSPEAPAPEMDRGAAERLLDKAGCPTDESGVRMRPRLATRQLYPQ